jgi:peptide chain release factor 1
VEVEINPEDLKIEFFRASGPGGQHVNKVSSAVRVTHLPTGETVSCQMERSQHKNRAQALRILRSHLYQKKMEKLHSEREKKRRSLIGSGDRSERIRTYNFPQNRVTDHRTGKNYFNLPGILMGDLDPIIQDLKSHSRQERLQELVTSGE